MITMKPTTLYGVKTGVSSTKKAVNNYKDSTIYNIISWSILIIQLILLVAFIIAVIVCLSFVIHGILTTDGGMMIAFTTMIYAIIFVFAVIVMLVISALFVEFIFYHTE